MAAKRKPEQPKARIACAFSGCQTPAILRLKRPTGWASLCRSHADRIWQDEADQFCLSQNLHTVAEKRAWIKEKLSEMRARQPSKKWAYDLLEKQRNGGYITPIQEEFAKRALGRQGVPDRIPGEDDDLAA